MGILLDINSFWLLDRISSISVALPITASIVRYGRLSSPLRVFSWLFFYSGINTFFVSWFASQGMNNLLFLNIYTIVELTLLGWVFRLVFEGQRLKMAIAITLLGFAAFAVINLCFLQGFTAINSYSKAIAGIILIVLALLFYYKIFLEEKVKRLEHFPMFWVSSGVLLFFGGNLFLFACSSYVLTDSPNALVATWSIHSVLNIMANLIYTAAFWVSPQH